MIAIGKLVPNENNCRIALPAIPQLARQIAASKKIATLDVAKMSGGKFLIVAGHRRHAAALLLNRWGGRRSREAADLHLIKKPWPKLPCDVVEIDFSQSLWNGLENIGRSNLNLYERGKVFCEVKEAEGLTDEEVAQRFAIGRTSVLGEMRIFKELAPECVETMKEWIEAERFTRRQINGALRTATSRGNSQQDMIAAFAEFAEGNPAEKKIRKAAKERVNASAAKPDEGEDRLVKFMRELKALPKTPASKAALATLRYAVKARDRTPIGEITNLVRNG